MRWRFEEGGGSSIGRSARFSSWGGARCGVYRWSFSDVFRWTFLEKFTCQTTIICDSDFQDLLLQPSFLNSPSCFSVTFSSLLPSSSLHHPPSEPEEDV